MLQNIVRIFGGDPNKKEVMRLAELAQEIDQLEPAFEQLSDQELRAKTDEFKARLADGETLDEILNEAFAAVREASKRTIGLRHFTVQMIGGMVLLQGKFAEMRTGEGKTLVATLPLYLNALAGKAFIWLRSTITWRGVTRVGWRLSTDAGFTSGVLQMAACTENTKAFLVDLEKARHSKIKTNCAWWIGQKLTKLTSPTAPIASRFDYLRDNLTNRLSERVHRGHFYAIVDEVDNILIDEARTPLIISGPAADETEWYLRMAQVVRALKEEDYEIHERDRQVTLTEVGTAHVEEFGCDSRRS